MAGVYWIGADGNYYAKSSGLEGVVNLGKNPSQNQNAIELLNGLDRIADPNPPSAPAPSGNTSTYAAAPDPDIAVRNQLRAEIGGKGGELDAIYAALFGELDNLIRSRDAELEEQYGGQLKKATEEYTGAIPTIESSYAALGAGESTDQSDAKTKAKKGFDETTETIGKNKQADKAKLGQYGNEQRAKFSVDRDSAKRNIGRAGETEDVDALRSLRNDIEGNIDSARVSRASLGTDQGARGEVSRITADAGRFQSAMNALDSIIKSSMSGSVKQAAVEAITDSAGLSEEEKQRVRQQYGDVYAEQAAL